VIADPIKIHQLIMNLCTNAYHAMMDKGGIMTVKLEDTAEKDQVILEVQDTGHGMPPNILEKVFEPYFTTKEAGKGTGLGLSVVQGIVKEYKGTISIKSMPDQGTTFIVSLPVAELETGTASLIADKQPPPPGTETIMIVDDESALLDSMQNYLEDFGYRVFTYADPVTALSVFKKDPGNIDLVITDMTMPGMTGDRLAVEILRHRPDTPVFLCTGYSETVSGSKARELGIREYIQKPMILSDLAVLIRNALD
jgi:CheY-like chemotaxis protein